MATGERQANWSDGCVDVAIDRRDADLPGTSRLALALRHSANLLSGFRLLLTVPLSLLVLVDSRASLLAAAGLFAVAAFTDMLDGYVARRWHAISALGAFLDPLADKCAIGGCIIALLLRSAFPPPLAIAIIGRDLLVTAIRIGQTGSGKRLVPSGLAKAKTLTLFVGVLGLLVCRASGAAPGGWMLLLVLGALLSLVSGAGYFRTTLDWRPKLSASLLCYLLFPRPGPLLSAGKIAFFLMGSFIAISAGIPAAAIWRWLAVFAIYELVLSQGKYLINDLAGRNSDGLFLRGQRNQCPRDGPGACLIAAYASVRAGAGIAALFVVAGWAVAAVGGLTVLLQVLYELLKIVHLPSRGDWLFAATSANYGLRALAGAGAVNAAAPVSTTGALIFLWASGLGALFLAFYWRQQGQYYVEQQRTAPDLLARYKPGVLSIYTRGCRADRLRRPLLQDRLLQGMAAGGILFTTLGSGTRGGFHSTALLLYLLWASFAFDFMRSADLRRLDRAAGPVLTVGLIAAVAGVLLHSAYLLPFVLGSVSLLTHLLLSSGAVRNQVLHGAVETDPRSP